MEDRAITKGVATANAGAFRDLPSPQARDRAAGFGSCRILLGEQVTAEESMSVSVTQQKMFVDGEFVDALSGETMDVLNPATGEVIAEVPKAGVEDVDRAVAAAEKAWETWRDKTPKDRMELLLKLADVIDENAEELARLESLNVGKPWWVAVDEPGVMSDNLRFFAGAARNLEGKAATEYVEGYTSMIRREPLGIVARDRAVELPALHGDLEDGARARGRERADRRSRPSRRRSPSCGSSSSRRRSSRRESYRS